MSFVLGVIFGIILLATIEIGLAVIREDKRHDNSGNETKTETTGDSE